jgi:hypothetical protein
MSQMRFTNGPGTFPPFCAPDPRPAVKLNYDLRILRGAQWGVGCAHGVGGAGDAPFAITNEPSPCVVTTVFKPIAPTKTSMARKTTASFLDMLPPGMNEHPETLYPYL